MGLPLATAPTRILSANRLTASLAALFAITAGAAPGATPDAAGSGSAEIVARRSVGFRVSIAASVLNGESLLVGDGRRHLVLLDAEGLEETRRMPIYHGSTKRSLAVTPDKRYVVVSSQSIDLNKLAPVKFFDVSSAIKGEPHAYAFAFAVSPDGRSALLYVFAPVDQRFAALVLFDLKSGKLLKTLDTENSQHIDNACFLDAKEVAIHQRDGQIVAIDVNNGKRRVLTRNAPRLIPSPAINAYMCASGDGDRLVVSGHPEFVVLDVDGEKEVSRTRVEIGNAVRVLGGQFFVFQGADVSEVPPLSPDGFYRPFFGCVRVSDGQVVAKVKRDGLYETLIPGGSASALYGIKYDTVSRLVFDWPEAVRRAGR